MKFKHSHYFFFIISLFLIGCGDSDPEPTPPQSPITVSYARLGSQTITGGGQVTLAETLVLGFNKNVSVNQSDFSLRNASGGNIGFTASFGQTNREVIITPNQTFVEGSSYQFTINNSLSSPDGGTFQAVTYSFTISIAPLQAVSVTLDGESLNTNGVNEETSLTPEINIEFSHPLTSTQVSANIDIEPNANLNVTANSDRSFTITPSSSLSYWREYKFTLEPGLGSAANTTFQEKEYTLFTTVDPTPKFSQLTEDELLTKVQETTFKYFWDFGHPVSGMARERNTSDNTVTSGGTGFGLLAMIVGVERDFITRTQAVERWQKIVGFLETADRFHGAWPHWINGTTGDVIPFSAQDDGADLVETAFLIQGLLGVRNYLDSSNATELDLINRITTLWQEVEWTWFQKNNENVLYWHWSPNNDFDINLRIRGHNETQVVYMLAAASPTFPISKQVYTNGYARNGDFTNGNNFYGINLPLGNEEFGGPLFFSHYSYLYVDPRNLADDYANYWTQNANHSLINYNYCLDNPMNNIGYSSQNWGLTASDGDQGYSAHSPTNDRGVITPTAAISSLPYTPNESMEAIEFFYYTIGDRLWGEYGFYDAFNAEEEWYAQSFLAIDQGPIICMIENHRTGLLWNLFASDSELKAGLDRLDITY